MRRTFAALLLVMAMLTPPHHAQAHDSLPFVRGSFAAIRASHTGKPLIVHIWSLTCAPCLTELPVWGLMAAAHRDIALVLIEADRPTDKPDPRAMGRLHSAGLDGVESWVFADRFEDRLRFEIDPDWQGELPRTLLVASNGTVSAVTGPIDATEVERWIAEQAR